VTELREIFDQFNFSAARREETQYLADRDSGAANARLSKADFRIDRNAVKMLHKPTLSPFRWTGNSRAGSVNIYGPWIATSAGFGYRHTLMSAANCI